MPLKPDATTDDTPVPELDRSLLPLPPHVQKLADGYALDVEVAPKQIRKYLNSTNMVWVLVANSVTWIKNLIEAIEQGQVWKAVLWAHLLVGLSFSIYYFWNARLKRFYTMTGGGTGYHLRVAEDAITFTGMYEKRIARGEIKAIRKKNGLYAVVVKGNYWQGCHHYVVPARVLSAEQEEILQHYVTHTPRATLRRLAQERRNELSAQKQHQLSPATADKPEEASALQPELG